MIKSNVILALALVLVLSGCANRNALYMNPPANMVEEVEALVPAAERFVVDNQSEALRNGVPLSPELVALAQKVGIAKPENVRLYYVDRLPNPSDPQLAAAARKFGYSSPFMKAYTYGYGIWIKQDAKHDKELLAHELIHVRQAEQLGLQEMIRQYLLQLYIYGYRDAPLEQEAYTEAAKYR